MERDDLFIYFGDLPINLGELGEIADMSITDAFQAIIDNGYLGKEVEGTPWYELIKPGCFSLDPIPDPEDTLLYSLWSARHDAEAEYANAVREGTATTEMRDNLSQLSRDYHAAKKLSTP